MTRHCPLHLGFPMCLGVLVAMCSVDKAKGRICENTLERQDIFYSTWVDHGPTNRMPGSRGGLYFAKTYSAKSKNQYRNAVNRTLPNQESDKPYSAKPTSGIC